MDIESTERAHDASLYFQERWLGPACGCTGRFIGAALRPSTCR